MPQLPAPTTAARTDPVTAPCSAGAPMRLSSPRTRRRMLERCAQITKTARATVNQRSADPPRCGVSATSAGSATAALIEARDT